MGLLWIIKNVHYVSLLLQKIDLIVKNVIPFFDKHSILESKHLNFLDFKSSANIIKNKEHLNEDGVGLKQIL